mmetsp:Transcript_24436/g.48679  ORF Transcript_24436/g.48679 Transcript_24436/m.48679 type:complete len:98 (+) Transcript_24436:174-467(+)
MSQNNSSAGSKKPSDQIKRERDDKIERAQIIQTSATIFWYIVKKPEIWIDDDMKEIRNYASCFASNPIFFPPFMAPSVVSHIQRVKTYHWLLRGRLP